MGFVRITGLRDKPRIHVPFWYNNIVPYVIDQWAFQDPVSATQTISAAINNWNATNEVTFRPKSVENVDYVAFVQARAKCNSPVGKQGGRQEVRCNLNGGASVQNVMHEMGHALGMYHEHQRIDRTNFVTISPIAPILQPANYAWRVDGINIGPYDCGSVMHYPNVRFLITLTGVNCFFLNRATLKPSPGDIATARWIREMSKVERRYTRDSCSQTSVFNTPTGQIRLARGNTLDIALQSNQTVVDWTCNGSSETSIVPGNIARIRVIRYAGADYFDYFLA